MPCATFAVYGTYPPPEHLSPPPPQWAATFARLAEQAGLTPVDMAAWTATVQDFYVRLLEA